MSNSSWYVYIIQTRCGAFYTGITTDVSRRFQEHLGCFEGIPKAKGAKYFRGREPLSVIFHEIYPNRSDATKRERSIKLLSRKQKMKLIETQLR